MPEIRPQHNPQPSRAVQNDPISHPLDDGATVFPSAPTEDSVTNFKRQPSEDESTSFKPKITSDDEITTFPSSSASLSEDDQATTFRQEALRSDLREDAQTHFPSRLSSPETTVPARFFYQPGTLVLRNKYELVEMLKGGAQALAFRGKRVLDDKVVFIKIQPNEVNGLKVFAKQIAIRSKMLTLSHPNLLKCLDWDLDRESLCEVYDYVEGTELSEWIPTANRPLPDALTENFVRQIAEAIHALHTQISLAHRDLKPSNIMVLMQDGKLHFKIVDYGTVSHLDSGGQTTVAGTRDYSPPEFYRRKVNNNDLSRWDWWSFGRILQTFLDGAHPFDRYLSNQAHINVRETLVDSIMLEDEIPKYKMRAGMVEMFEKDRQFARWLPLLRGLLASNKQSRWGYDQIDNFLQGKSVPDAYAQSIEIDAYPYNNEYWNIADLAKKWIAEGAKEEKTWQTAREQIYGGELILYIAQTLHDELLLRDFRECRKVNNPDLGTGLALALLARHTEGDSPVQIFPAVRDKVINRDYVVAVAQEDTEAVEKLVAEMMSTEFRQILEQVAPQATNSLIELSREMEKLKADAEQYRLDKRKTVKPQFTRLVRLIAASNTEVAQSIEKGAKQHFDHTNITKLQTLYGTPDLSSLPAHDLKVLSLILDTPGEYEFVTNESEAKRLSREANQYRQADAYWQMANYCSWKWALLTGKSGAVFRIWSVIALFGMCANALHYALPTRRPFEFNYPSLFLSAVGFALAFTSTRNLVFGALCRVLTQSEPVGNTASSRIEAKDINAYALRERARSLAPTPADDPKTFGRLLEDTNARIRQIPGIETSKYVVERVSFKKAFRFMALQAILIVLLLMGGTIYSQWLGK